MLKVREGIHIKSGQDQELGWQISDQPLMGGRTISKENIESLLVEGGVEWKQLKGRVSW